MRPDWHRLWVAALQTIPAVLGALALTWLCYRLAGSLASTTLGVAAALLSLMALAALLGLDLSSPWGELVLLIFGGLIGLVLATWGPALVGRASTAIGVGIGLMFTAGFAGCLLDRRLVGLLAPWLTRLAWLYLLGWIPILTTDPLKNYADAWATFGLVVFLMLAATWTAAVRARDALMMPARSSLQLYLLGLNVVLALTIITSSTA